MAAAATAAVAAAGVVVAAAVEVGGQVVEVVKARMGGGAAAGSNDMTGVCVIGWVWGRGGDMGVHRVGGWVYIHTSTHINVYSLSPML